MTLPRRSLAKTSVCPESASLLRASLAVSTTTENELSLTLACIQYGASVPTCSYLNCPGKRPPCFCSGSPSCELVM